MDNQSEIPELAFEERLSNLKSQLKENNLPIDKWTGMEGTKSVSDLQKEIDSGETEVNVKPEGGVERVVHVVAGDVFYLDAKNNQLYRLKEDRQVFKADGSVKRRPGLHGAVAEKMKATEDPTLSTIRGLDEELGIKEDFKVGSETLLEETRETPTYPGLNSLYKIHKVPVRLGDSSYNPDGYVEHQDTKTNYFVWERLDTVPDSDIFK